ncbi:putative 28S rRNA (cytosine-C(5))-methyltransferase [Coemansia interrupta]|uniref:28S rRNA (Cytosine-C(5))-methyltransferase n=1 Tax=Coemansia interrupta TaxID=1126814 RepID=A0A9W8H883_9FUNG|nr:putative 28S rRNA (cytosine-C(5))-methyltransferase [Coemansia interrupta]
MYALICETLKHADVLTQAVSTSGILADTSLGIDERAVLVMAHDLLLARGGLQRRGADHAALKRFAKHREALQGGLAEVLRAAGASSAAELVPAELRAASAGLRYVRVNLLCNTVAEAVAKFVADGYELVGPGEAHRLVRGTRVFMQDEHLEDLLVFAPGTEMHAHGMLADGSVVVQDKASCMAAHVARPTSGKPAIDACAAPGNKTSHLASLMGGRGTVYAFDRDARRLRTLVEMTRRARCTMVEAQCMSFLDVDPLDPRYAQVDCLLLDPSCSGSGMAGQLDLLVDRYVALRQGTQAKEDVKTRVASLAQFQTDALVHAMRFPGVQRISYSTCSVHVEENEAVVAAVLGMQEEFALAPRTDVLPTWPRRGLSAAGLTEAQADCLVRAMPEDGTNGFFVAGFVRVSPPDVGKTREYLEERRVAQGGMPETEVVEEEEKVSVVPPQAKKQKKNKDKPPGRLPGRRATSVVMGGSVNKSASKRRSKRR